MTQPYIFSPLDAGNTASAPAQTAQDARVPLSPHQAKMKHRNRAKSKLARKSRRKNRS